MTSLLTFIHRVTVYLTDRSKRRDWASGLAYDFAPWWIVCPMTTKEKKERVAETARILETKLANPH